MASQDRETEHTYSVFDHETVRFTLAAQLLRAMHDDPDFVLLSQSYHRPDGSATNEGIVNITVTGNMLAGHHGGTRLLEIMLDGIQAGEKIGYRTAEEDMQLLAAQEGTSSPEHVPRHRLSDEPNPAE